MPSLGLLVQRGEQAEKLEDDLVRDWEHIGSMYFVRSISSVCLPVRFPSLTIFGFPHEECERDSSNKLPHHAFRVPGGDSLKKRELSCIDM